MKRKTNISVQDNRGSRVISNMHVSEEYHGYIPGDPEYLAYYDHVEEITAEIKNLLA